MLDADFSQCLDRFRMNKTGWFRPALTAAQSPFITELTIASAIWLANLVACAKK